MNYTKKQKIIFFAGAFALLLLAFSNSSLGQSIKLNPIKPAPKQTKQLTDEQQAILAVRGVKPSVVNILGIDSSIPSNPTTVRGTGFIWGSSGLIVSNNHVVQDSNIKYYVVFADGSHYDAKVLGQDKFNDVALLQIQISGLAAVKLGDSDVLETGQTVFAIGNSLGKYQNTVTKGVVSGLGRAISLEADSTNPKPRLQNLIQTDAAINPGNSGGPLINLAGEVVGMNTLIDTEGEGLGFAVPINVIKASVDQLQKFGKVSRPYFGISFMTVDQVLQIAKKLTVSQGALISKVFDASPASLAGIRAGDIITQINHEQLTENNELDNILLKYPAGTQLLVTLLRDGQQMDFPVLLTEFK